MFQILKRTAPGQYKTSKLKPFPTFRAAASHVCAKVKPTNRLNYVIKRIEVQA